MKVLLLSDSQIIYDYLISQGEKVEMTMEPVEDFEADFIVSYGYKHILKKPILDKFKDRAVNLHISYLPFNRGAHPVFHGLKDGTPMGVAIHFMDEGVDTGDIICQRYLKYDYDADTLRTLYDKHKECVEDLFMRTWKYISEGRAKRYHACYHRSEEIEEYADLLPLGWDTPVKEVLRRIKKKEK